MRGEGPSRSVVLARRPAPTLTEDCLQLVMMDGPRLESGQVVVETEYLSCDPYLRLRMQDSFVVGQPVPARALGRVVDPGDTSWNVGDQVWGNLSWSEFAVAAAADLYPVEPTLPEPAHALSVCGVPGLTAYIGMMEKGRPVAEENVVVSGAAGAVGSIAGQLARHAGARVVGIVGSEPKARYVVEQLGFHAAAVRTASTPLETQLETVCPGGIDVCFENVGGAVLDASLSRLNDQARVVMCGGVAGYDVPRSAAAVQRLMSLCGGESSIRGLNVARHIHRLPAVARRMADLVRSGDVRFKHDLVYGLENLPAAFAEMLAGGGGIGKRLVKIV